MDFLVNILNQSQILDANASPLASFAFILTHGGFVFIIYAIIEGLVTVWLDSRYGIAASKIKYVFLAIDVPKDNEQSPKAVEQIFNHLWGTISGPIFKDKWWEGFVYTTFSLELVSVGGYIQYIIRAPSNTKDLVEAAVYAQYPGAQITEIEDYAKDITPDNFKELGYDLWGAQLQQLKEEAYPIKTYPAFEHMAAKTIVDPMAAVLEVFSKLGPTEQAWFQIVIKPIGDPDWQPKALEEAKKILGTTKEATPVNSLTDKILSSAGSSLTNFADNILVASKVEKKEEKKSENPSKMMYLSPMERATVEAIENKASKTGFTTKMRYIYLGKKPGMNKTTGVSGFWGAFKQHAGLNGFKPHGDTMTSANYFFKSTRLYHMQKDILREYKSRSLGLGVNSGRGRYVLNTEELASIYHFPYKGVGGASVKSVGAKRAEAPYILPVETAEDAAKEEARKKRTTTLSNGNGNDNNHKKDTATDESIDIPPDNLPI